MQKELTFLLYGGGHQDRCGHYGCDRPATGWLASPDGQVVPGITCGECAVDVMVEYEEKLGQTWTYHAGETRCDRMTDNITRVLQVRIDPETGKRYIR